MLVDCRPESRLELRPDLEEVTSSLRLQMLHKNGLITGGSLVAVSGGGNKSTSIPGRHTNTTTPAGVTPPVPNNSKLWGENEVYNLGKVDFLNLSLLAIIV